MTRTTPTARFAWLSIAAAIVTITLKMTAFLITNSVGLLSDALESFVNLATAVIALIALIIAVRPPDEEHAYGHSKVEYLSSGAEGLSILAAAILIAATAGERLLRPQPVEGVGVGLAISTAASLVNLGVALVLRRAGRQRRSIALEAESRHLMTDVWTSAGVLIGVAGVGLSGWHWLDAVVALLVAANIAREGYRIADRSIHGVLDTALDTADLAAVEAILAQYREQGVEFHALRTRQAAARNFISLHMLVPGEWTVRRSHAFTEEIEAEIRRAVPNVTITTHLEPLGDPAALRDATLTPIAE